MYTFPLLILDGKNLIVQHAANLIDPEGKTALHLAAEKGISK